MRVHLRVRGRTILRELKEFAFGKTNFGKKYSLGWCDPNEIKLSTLYFNEKSNGYLKSGREKIKQHQDPIDYHYALDGDWDQHVTNIEDVNIIRWTADRYQSNKRPAEGEEVQWMLQNISQYGVQDGCRNSFDIAQRFKKLDRLYEELSMGGSLIPQKRLYSFNFREYGGISIGISRTGQLIWLGNGAHRLAISKILRLPLIPVSIELIHTDNPAISVNKLQALRNV